MLLFFLIVSLIWFVLLTFMGNLGCYLAARKGRPVTVKTWTVMVDILATGYIIWYFIR